ncbi:MAG: hypothetical protein Sapg2KO_36960 [Saprospiraceae bacterium]
MKVSLSQYLEQQWPGSEFHLLRSSNVMANYLLESLSVRANEYLICDPLLPVFLLEALKALKVQLIFIDLKSIDGSLDLDLLEDFLSLSTLINEKDELVYRKDNAVIKGIISSTPWRDPKELQRFLFTGQRYYLKTILTTNLNDLIHPKASQYYQADLIAGPIQIAGASINLVLRPQPKQAIPALSGFGKVLLRPVVLAETQLKETDIPEIDTDTFLPNQSLERTESLFVPYFFPSFIQIFSTQRATSKNQLAARGFSCIIPFEDRLADLKSATFLTRSKAGEQYLTQVLDVIINSQEELMQVKKNK